MEGWHRSEEGREEAVRWIEMLSCLGRCRASERGVIRMRWEAVDSRRVKGAEEHQHKIGCGSVFGVRDGQQVLRRVNLGSSLRLLIA